MTGRPEPAAAAGRVHTLTFIFKVAVVYSPPKRVIKTSEHITLQLEMKALSD